MQVAAEPVERDVAGRLSQLECLQYELTRQVRVLGAVKHKKPLEEQGMIVLMSLIQWISVIMTMPVFSVGELRMIFTPEGMQQRVCVKTK